MEEQMNSSQYDNIKKIIKTTYVNFLLGAGTSYNKIEGTVNYPLMADLYSYVCNNNTIKAHIDFFNSDNKENFFERKIVYNTINNYLLKPACNIENFLSVIEGIDMYLTDIKVIEHVKIFQNDIKNCILTRIKESNDDTVLDIYKNFYYNLRNLKKQSSRSQQSYNIFTTNYDMLNEKAMELINTHYYSGFFGITNRVFNITYYNSHFSSSYNVKGAEYVVNDNHINLYKLHGSISWRYKDNKLTEVNPYEVEGYAPEIIYPSIAKFNSTNMIVHYSALIREFSNKICQQNTCLVVNGTGMNDEHINKIIDNALLINSFTLIIFAYPDEQIKTLKEKYESFENVIVYDKSTTFKQLSQILKSITGEENEPV